MFRYSSRFWLYAPISIFLLIAVAVMVHWKIAADAFEKKLAAVKGHEAAPGIVLDWDSVTVSGFPFRLDADFTNFSVHGAAARGPFVWKTKQFALHTLAYGPRKTVYEAAGPQHLEWSAIDGRHTVDLLPATLRGSSITDARGLVRADIDGADVGSKGLTATRMQFHLRRDPDGKHLDLNLSADNLRREQQIGLPLNFNIYLRFSRLDAITPLLTGSAGWPQTTSRWRGMDGAHAQVEGTIPYPAEIGTTILSAIY
jgi:hypothetical protein